MTRWSDGHWLVERYIERHDGSWCICGGYVVITSEGRDLVGEAAKSLGPLRSVQSESSGTSTIAPRSVVETATVYRNDRWKCFLSAANRYDHHITYVICTIGARADDETAKSAVDYYICEITSRNHIQSGATDFAVRAVVAIPCNRDEGGKVRRRRHPGDVDRMVCALQTSIDEMLNMQALPLDISKVLQKIRDEDASTVSGVPDSALRGRYLGIDGSDSRAKDIYRQCQRELNGEPRWTFTLMQMQDRVADHEGAISFSCAKIGIRRFWPSDSIELLTRIHP